MMWSLLAGALLALAASLPSTSATDFNVSKAMESSLAVSHVTPDTECQVPGICSPVNQTIPANTLFYWCGFLATHRTRYSVNTTSKTTIQFMREDELNGCALSNLTLAGTCKYLASSRCDKKTTCAIRLFGLSFSDVTCLVISNPNAKAVTASIRVNNYYDSPRYYGTVFSLFFVITGGMYVLGTVGYQFYKGIVAPVHKPKHKPAHEDDTAVPPMTDASSPEAYATLQGGAAGGATGWKAKLQQKLHMPACLTPEKRKDGHQV